MAEIRFTLGDLDEWHVIHLDYELTKEKFKDIGSADLPGW